MPVIREKKNFSIGPVGVTRASEAGRITGQAITQSANQIGEIFFQRAAKQAEEFGLKEGASVDREQVIAINPQTGEPEAYEPPQGLGSIGADAYQRVVMTRFQTSIEDEIRNKGQELAVRFENNSNGVALYTNAMSDYISSMTDVAQDEFKAYIADVGTTYLNATRTSMAATQVRRERAAAAASVASAYSDGIDNIRMIVSQTGASSLEDGGVARTLQDSLSASLEDGVSAGLISRNQANAFERSNNLSVAMGLVGYAASQTDDPDELRLLQGAIGIQNANLVPDQFPEIADVIRGFGSDYSALEDLEKYSDGLLSDRVQYAEVIQRRELDAIERERAAAVIEASSGSASESFTQSTLFRTSTRSIRNLASSAIAGYINFTADAAQYARDGNQSFADLTIERRDDFVAGSARGFYARLLTGLTPEETDAVENSIQTIDPATNRRSFLTAPESTRPILHELNRIQNETGLPVLDNLLPVLGSYRTSGAKDNAVLLEAAALDAASEIDIESIRSSANPEESLQGVLAQLGAIPDLPDPVSKGLRDTAYLAAGRNNLNRFFSSNLSEVELREGNAVIQGLPFDSEALSSAQIESLKTARAYGIEAGNITDLTKAYGTGSGIQRLRLQEQEEARELQQQISTITLGYGDPSSQTDRELVDQILAEELGIDFISPSFYSNPDVLNSEEGSAFINSALGMTVMPQSLQVAFTQFANGQFRGDMPTFINVIRNFRNIEVNGVTLMNPAFKSLDSADIAVLDYFADIVETVGSDSSSELTQAYSQFLEYQPNERSTVLLTEKLGMPVEDYIYTISDGWFVNGVDEAPSSVVSNLTAQVLRLDAAGATESEIKTQLRDQLDRTYPDGRGAVLNNTGGSRSKFALEITQGISGYVPEFKEHTLSQITQDSSITDEFGLELNLASPSLGDINIDMGTDVAASTDHIYLVPLSQSAGEDVRYTVRLRRPAEDGGPTVLYRQINFDPRGDSFEAGQEFQVDTAIVPLTVSNRDPSFLAVRNVLEQQRRVSAQEDADAAELRRAGYVGPIGGFIRSLRGVE